MKCWADEPWLRSFMIGTLDLYIAISVLDSFLSSGSCICPPNNQLQACLREQVNMHTQELSSWGWTDFLGHDWEDLIATDWLYAPYGGAQIGVAGGE